MRQDTEQNEIVSPHKKSVQLNNFNTDFDLGLFLHILRKNLKWIVLLIVLSILGAYLYFRYTAPTYNAKAEIQIEKDNQANQLLEVGDYYESKDISSDIELLKSPMLLRNTLEKLPLSVSYFSEGQFLQNENYKSSPYEVDVISKDSALASITIQITFDSDNGGKLRWENNNQIEFKNNQLIDLPFAKIKIRILDYARIKKELTAVKGVEYLFVLNSLMTLVNDELRKLEIVILNPSAKTLQINFSDNNRLKAYDIIRTLIQEFRNYNLEKKKQSSAQILDFLNGQISSVYEDQKMYERQIQTFKRENDITNIDQLATAYNDRMSQMNQVQIELSIQESALNEINEQIKKAGKEINIYDFLPMLLGTQQQSGLEKLIENLNQLLLKKQESLYTLKKGSAPINEIDYQISIQKKLITNSITSLQKKVNNRQTSIQQNIKEIQLKHFGHPEAEVELLRLKHLYGINESFYTMLIQKKTEYTISQKGFVYGLNILKAVTIPESPISPNKNIIYTGFLLIGFIVSLLFLIVKYLFHNQITTISDINRLSNFHYNILGVIPTYKKNIPISQLIINKNPKSLIAESFRSVRSNLEFLSSQKGAKVMAITSTISGEGKTFIAINLGGIIALSGKKVIVLDLDMRKPKIHHGFNVNNSKGMSTILIGKDNLEDCIHHSKQENLDFITAGPIPPNPSELILNNILKTTIEKLKETYDLIVIDNPPVGLVTDGIEVFRMADYPIYIFRSEYSRKNFIQNIDKLISDSNINNPSIILNGIDLSKRGFGYGYSYGGYNYGYGYGQGYYDDQNDNSKKSFFSKWKKK